MMFIVYSTFLIITKLPFFISAWYNEWFGNTRWISYIALRFSSGGFLSLGHFVYTDNSEIQFLSVAPAPFKFQLNVKFTPYHYNLFPIFVALHFFFNYRRQNYFTICIQICTNLCRNYEFWIFNTEFVIIHTWNDRIPTS